MRPSSNTRDPMHTALSNGVMNTEIFLLLRAYKQCTPGFSYGDLAAFIEADWQWPRVRRIVSVSSRLARCFDVAHEASSIENESFRSSASETLSVYPIIRYWVEAVVAVETKIPAERASFLSLCKVVDLMYEAKALNGTSPALAAQFDAEVPRSLYLHKEAYGIGFIKPKRHFLFHIDLSEFFRDCFVHERKHKVIKDAAKDIQNTRDFEASALLVILNSTHGQMDAWTLSSLRKPTAVSPELSAAFGTPVHVSNAMRWRVLQIGIGDIFFLSANGAVEIIACARLGDDGNEYRCVVRELNFIEQMSPTTSRWRRTLSVGVMEPRPQMWLAKAWFSRDDTFVGLS